MTNIVSEFKPNQKQQECIDNINGKYLVLAGPGTGKTFTIINRIKNMVEKGVNPEKILCLTFTDAAVNEMKKRIEKSLGVLSTDINISTYHSFCCDIINENIEKFELPNNYNVITDSISRVFIKESIDEINPKYLRTDKNDPYFYINKIKNFITKIKQYRLTKEQYFENITQNPDWEPEVVRLKDKIDEKIRNNKTNYTTDKKDLESIQKKINQAKEIWTFYELYQEKLAEKRYLDFNDMINLVLDKFDSEQLFLEEIANKYEYILVDEYQDTNHSQNEIIFNLTRAINSENVFVVGDDDQIIFRFQGAKLDTIERFLKEFPETKVICLTENMRSTQNILDTSRAVAIQDTLRLENNAEFSKYNITKALTAKNEEVLAKNKLVRCYKYADIMQEYNEILEEIELLINSDDCPVDENGEKLLSQIAILTISNNEAQEFAQMFKAKNIPYELKEGKNIFDINAVNILYFYIQFLVNPELYSHRMFQLLLCKPFDINPKDYQVLYENISKEKVFIDIMRDIPKEKFVKPDKIQRFIDTFDYLSKYKTKENVKNAVLEIGSKTGIFEYYLHSEINQTENIAGLKKFIDETASYAEIYQTGFLEGFVDYIRAMILNEEALTTEKSPVPMNAVQLCTYHSSKGREFEYVYMPTLISEKWESSSRSVKEEIPIKKNEYKNADELKEIKYSDLIKLMYVGMTRAKHTLRLSYPMQIKGKNKKPSRFIANISELFETEEIPFEYTEQSFWEEMKKTLIKEDYDYEKDYKDLIDAKLNDKVFSPSSINRYLACPRQYLYSDILKLDGKDGNPNYLSYGSAIHKACELTVKYQKENNAHPEKEMVIRWFKKELDRLPMEDYNQRLIFEERGANALDKYYAQIVNTQIKGLCEVEYEILDELDGIKFKGIIDRLDKNEDGSYTIYDYKTGNKKNGVKPDGEHEDYYNQMCLYKYFYEKKYGVKVSATAFLYPEDFTNNLYLNLTDEECQAVVEKFKTAVKSIYNYEFKPSFKKEACQYCSYKVFCQTQ